METKILVESSGTIETPTLLQLGTAEHNPAHCSCLPYLHMRSTCQTIYSFFEVMMVFDEDKDDENILKKTSLFNLIFEVNVIIWIARNCKLNKY